MASLPSLAKRIILHPWSSFSDIAVFVLKRDVKLQPTNWVQQTALNDVDMVPAGDADIAVTAQLTAAIGLSGIQYSDR